MSKGDDVEMQSHTSVKIGNRNANQNRSNRSNGSNGSKWNAEKCKNCMKQKKVWIPLVVLGSIGLLLTVILVPLSFSYVEYDQMAFKKSTISNVVDKSQVYHNGRYMWGPTSDPETFPTTYQLIQYRGNDLLIFSDNGLEFSIEVDVYYKLEPENLAAIFSDFAQNYHDRFHDAIKASLKNSAPSFTVDDFITKRQEIADAMTAELNVELVEFHISIEPHKLQLLRVVFPDLIRNKNLQTAVQELVNAQSELQREVEIIKKDTEKIIEGITANITITRETAVAEANTVVENSKEQSKNIVQTAIGTGINDLMSGLGVSTSSERTALYELLTVKDSPDTQRALIGDLSSIIQI